MKHSRLLFLSNKIHDIMNKMLERVKRKNRIKRFTQMNNKQRVIVILKMKKMNSMKDPIRILNRVNKKKIITFKMSKIQNYRKSKIKLSKIKLLFLIKLLNCRLSFLQILYIGIDAKLLFSTKIQLLISSSQIFIKQNSSIIKILMEMFLKFLITRHFLRINKCMLCKDLI